MSNSTDLADLNGIRCSDKERIDRLRLARTNVSRLICPRYDHGFAGSKAPKEGAEPQPREPRARASVR